LAQKDLQLERSRRTTYGIGGGLVLVSLLAGLLYLRQKARKKAHAQAVQALKQEKEIQLLQALMQGEEQERSRIAKDLHDGAAGMLAAVKMHFSTLGFQHHEVLQAEGYRQGLQLLDEAAAEVRKTSHNLMPEVLMHHGLDEALRRYCHNLSNSRSLHIQYDSWGSFGRFRDSFELSVYRIVQELLNNIVKHSKANEAIVQVSVQDSLLSITIEDNGIGFQKSPSDGMGLNALRSRVQALHGKIEWDSAAGSGVAAYLEFETAGLEKVAAEAEAV
ncbi:MAG TPA: ATP-binding protein, partial [Chitinophagaceae bacterium]|nr:ATP-binding protein [Chitinophagaceae bacterium]